MSKLIDFQAEYIKRQCTAHLAEQPDEPLVAANDNPSHIKKMVAGRARFLSLTGEELLITFNPKRPPSLEIGSFFGTTWDDPS